MRVSQLCGKSEDLGFGGTIPREGNPQGCIECKKEVTAGAQTRTKSPSHLQEYELLSGEGTHQVYFVPGLRSRTFCFGI